MGQGGLHGEYLRPEDSSPPDSFAALPAELRNTVFYVLRYEGGIKSLFPHRAVSRHWRRIIDEHLYDYFTKGPDTLYCYVNLWNRFRQKLIQQRVVLRLRCRLMEYKSKTPSEAESPDSQFSTQSVPSLPPQREEEKEEEKQEQTRGGLVSWQPSSESSETPSLSPRRYKAFIYDACFDRKYQTEKDQITPLDIQPRTRSPIFLASGLKRLMERSNQPPRSGTIFPLFHIIQEAWDFILGDDAALVPIYPPIASEAWLQIRLATGSVPELTRERPQIYIEPAIDPYWPFRFDEFLRFPTEHGDETSGEHQYAVVSRLALPNLVEDEGILLVTIRDTELGEWITDDRFREIMQSMINIADIGGPQEFILGGAVVGLQDFARFIPVGMIPWFRRRILGQSVSPYVPGVGPFAGNNPSRETPEDGDGDGNGEGREEQHEPDDFMQRMDRALEILRYHPGHPPVLRFERHARR